MSKYSTISNWAKYNSVYQGLLLKELGDFQNYCLFF